MQMVDQDEIEHIPKFPSEQVLLSQRQNHAYGAYAEFLSDRHQIPSSEFDPKKHHTRYTFLLWDYGVNKSCTGYVSDNQDLPRPKRTFIQSEDTEMIDAEP
ncbi:hypothetical protein BC332_26122 [Capsicum chinense]|nr:hypothetical protein BC332_26122 [Capsicum chinense]